LCCAVLGTACASEVSGPSAVETEIVGVPWQLTGLARTGEAIVPPPPGTFTLELREEGALHLVADCNVCNGSYSLEGDSLEVVGGVLACTRAACPSAPFDTTYAQIVSGVRTFEADSTTLSLVGDEGRLSFERGEP